MNFFLLKKNFFKAGGGGGGEGRGLGSVGSGRRVMGWAPVSEFFFTMDPNLK